MFNSRACQLILGAGATKSAGLKNITTKHLALASQGLSIIISLIPYLRECSRRHGGSTTTTLMAEFDKVKRVRFTSTYTKSLSSLSCEILISSLSTRPTKTTKRKSTTSSSPSWATVSLRTFVTSRTSTGIPHPISPIRTWKH